MQNLVPVTITDENAKITVDVKMHGFNSVHGIATTHGEVQYYIDNAKRDLEHYGKTRFVSDTNRVREGLSFIDGNLTQRQETENGGHIINDDAQCNFNDAILHWIGMALALGQITNIHLLPARH